jgi:hypothetical protein
VLREIYKAKVSRVNDPANLGRIRVTCEALAAPDVEIPIWVDPIFPQVGAGSWGWFLVPDPGDEVELEVAVSSDDDEVPGETLLRSPAMRYRAGTYGPNNKLHDDFKTNYPKRRGFRTKAGHILFFDDTEGKEEVVIKAAFGKAKPTTIRLTKNSVVVDNPDAHVAVKCKSIDIIDGANQKMVLGDNLKTFLVNEVKNHADTHTHVAGSLTAPPAGGPVTGTTGPAVAPMGSPPDNILSDLAKLK